MNKLNDRLNKLVQDHPITSLVVVTVAGYAVGTIAGNYLAKGLLKAASGTRVL